MTTIHVQAGLPRAVFGQMPLIALLCVLGVGAQAQEPGRGMVYRCPGPPVLYTDALTPEEARERGCRTIEGAPLTVVQVPRRPAPPARPASGAQTLRPPESKVDSAAQRARDTDARRILEQELRREEERLVELRKEFNNGEPERRGDERNYARYQERVEQMRAAIQRKEADLAAIRRELAKLPP
jgi:hypothetical protein